MISNQGLAIVSAKVHGWELLGPGITILAKGKHQCFDLSHKTPALPYWSREQCHPVTMQCIICHGISLCRHAGISVLGSLASTDGHVASLMLLYQQIKLYRPRSACSSFAGVGTVPDWLHVQGHYDAGALMQCFH